MYIKHDICSFYRCIKKVTDYRNAARDSQYREDILVVVGDHRGVLQDLRRAAQRRINRR